MRWVGSGGIQSKSGWIGANALRYILRVCSRDICGAVFPKQGNLPYSQGEQSVKLMSQAVA
jgi:hypothetical protein